MNPLVELWIASALGAVLFFAAGYALCHVLRRTEQVMADSSFAHLRAELEHAQLAYAAQGRELDHLEHRTTRAEQSAADLSDALSDARAECARLDKELRRHTFASERASALERENGMLIAQVRARALTSTEAEVTELREKLERAEARSKELLDELRAQKSVDKAPAAQRQLAELRQRIGETAKARAHWESRARALEGATRVQAAADTANTALTLEVKRLERTARQRAEQSRALAKRLTQLEHSATENALLRKQRDALTLELQRLREAQSPSEAPLTASGPSTSGFILPAPDARELKQSGIAPRMLRDDETLGGMLSRQLALLVEREPGVTAVLSDEHGLPLVGTGPEQEQEGVSVLTAMLQGLAVRARELSGLGQIELMEMVDGGGRALRVRFFDWDGQALALGYVCRPRLAQSEGEARMVSTFPQLRAARSA